MEALPGDDPANADIFAVAAVHPASSVRARVASKKRLPLNAVLTLAADPSAAVRCATLLHPELRRVAKEGLLLRMMASDPAVASVVARMLNRFELASIAELCEAVAVHKDPDVRLAAASSDDTPRMMLNRLSKDPSAEVAAAATRSLLHGFD